MASVIDGDMIMVTISDDEDDAVVGNPGIEESRKSNGSANLPTPPPAIPTVLNNENGRLVSVFGFRVGPEVWGGGDAGKVGLGKALCLDRKCAIGSLGRYPVS